MKTKWCIAAMWLLALLPLALVAVLYARLPDQVPMHWGIDGEVNRWGSKSELWLMGALGPLFALLFQFLPRLDPRKRSYEKFQKYYEATALVLTAFIAVIMGVTLAEILRPGTLSLGRVISALVGLLFLFVGNLMGKVKSNFFMGIRNPWTLSDPDVWNRTHRLSGKLLFASGLLVLLSSFLLAELATFFLLAACSAVCLAVPAAMSRVWYKRLHPPGDSPPDT